MGVGDPVIEVSSDIESNNPVARTVLDQQQRIDTRLKVLERVAAPPTSP